MTQRRFETAITKMFGIRHPVLCGGLMWLSNADYVAAVARAGGLGFITSRSFKDLGHFRAEIQKCRDLAQGNPIGVNLYMTGRDADDSVNQSYVDVLVDEGVKAVETAANTPRSVLPRLKEAGCTVIHKASVVRHAEKAVRDGADAVVIVGMECGGHPGLDFIGSMVQGAIAPDRIKVPVVLGGGFGTGRQLVAALAMGAAGVMLGTRMLVAKEIWADERIKQRVIDADEGGSRLVLSSLRKTYRVMDNTTARKVAELEAAGETDFEVYRPLVQGSFQVEAYESGDPEKGLLSMGQSAVFADRIAPVEEIYGEIMDDAERSLDKLRRVTLGM